MDYAIIRVGNKQHRVRDGETLVVDRVHADEGGTFTPEVLLGSAKVTLKVVAHERGPKIRIGKYRKRTGYKRHNGFRARLTRIEIESITAKKAAPKKKDEGESVEEKAESKPKVAAKPKAPAKPKATAEKKTAEKVPAKKPAPKKEASE